MTSNPTKADNFVVLPESDKQRMAQLYEEVHARLTEMSLIMTRNLGMTRSRNTRVMFRPMEVQEDNAKAFDTEQLSLDGPVEVHCTETPPGHFECGCYDYSAGTCGPC